MGRPTSVAIQIPRKSEFVTLLLWHALAEVGGATCRSCQLGGSRGLGQLRCERRHPDQLGISPCPFRELFFAQARLNRWDSRETLWERSGPLIDVVWGISDPPVILIEDRPAVVPRPDNINQYPGPFWSVRVSIS